MVISPVLTPNSLCSLCSDSNTLHSSTSDRHISTHLLIMVSSSFRGECVLYDRSKRLDAKAGSHYLLDLCTYFCMIPRMSEHFMIIYEDLIRDLLSIVQCIMLRNIVYSSTDYTFF